MTPSSLFAIFCIFLWLNIVRSNVTFEVSNNEPGPIWVGVQSDPGHPYLAGGGFTLDQGQTKVVTAPSNWSGRFWPRTWCDILSQHCETGNCGNKIACGETPGNPPFTSVEVTLKGYKGLDYYYVSLIKGMNLKAHIEPVKGRKSNAPFSCQKVKCYMDINLECPNDLRVIHDGQTIACHSACTSDNSDMYCCRGYHDRPETCNSTQWRKDYPAYFKQRCPDAYIYLFDPKKHVFTCEASLYRIQFGASF